MLPAVTAAGPPQDDELGPALRTCAFGLFGYLFYSRSVIRRHERGQVKAGLLAQRQQQLARSRYPGLAHDTMIAPNPAALTSCALTRTFGMS
jgi:hypothetical protein